MEGRWLPDIRSLSFYFFVLGSLPAFVFLPSAGGPLTGKLFIDLLFPKEQLEPLRRMFEYVNIYTRLGGNHDISIQAEIANFSRPLPSKVTPAPSLRSICACMSHLH